ncbi:acyltransferase ChoActase/COT/CPT [Gongronella butleri]|nr:acyltransferase ChoActase/COT/CPT [Gongronella butleri]
MTQQSIATHEVEPITFKYQDKLPKLPIPDLRETADRYLSALRPLQSDQEHEMTKRSVEAFMEQEGPMLQEKLQTYATDKSSYIEEFWYDSYLQYTDPVVLNLNPFFLLEDDPTPQRNDQIVRASSLIASTVTFVDALFRQTLEPDSFRGVPLCMSQFNRLFGTARVPTEEHGCYMATAPRDLSKHIVVMAHSQCYHFDVFDDDGNIAMTEKEIANNLRAIVRDASQVDVNDIAKNAIGVLTTENRRNWAKYRTSLQRDPVNRAALQVVESALFIVCLDHVQPTDIEDLSTNMLCGTYNLDRGRQVGTCTNRWYDKLQIIVCKNGSAGINFEHTGVDGHTVLRFVSDIYTDTILRFAKTINSQTKSIFHSQRKHASPPRSAAGSGKARRDSEPPEYDGNPRRIEWNMTQEITLGVRYAETRLSDLILQNEVKVLEFTKYGKYFITDMKMSPDAFVQMAFQAAYYGLYGKVECTYEPAMTKAFFHGRTESVRSVTEESLRFVQLFHSDAPAANKLNALRDALKKHTQLTKDCARGHGQDRHLYALECLFDRLHKGENKPLIFTDNGWRTINHTVLSTSNCGNPALRLFGFGPVVSDGFGIGYIIKEDGIAFVASSKHRQTERLLATLEAYLLDIRQLLINEKYPGGMSQRQRLLAMEDAHNAVNGYSYFDNGEDDYSATTSASDDNNPSPRYHRKVGKRLVIRATD